MFQFTVYVIKRIVLIKVKLLKLLLQPSSNHLFGLVKVVYVKKNTLENMLIGEKTSLNIIPRESFSNNN